MSRAFDTPPSSQYHEPFRDAKRAVQVLEINPPSPPLDGAGHGVRAAQEHVLTFQAQPATVAAEAAALGLDYDVTALAPYTAVELAARLGDVH